MYNAGLGWAKALDSISPSSLLTALSRFGLPTKMLDMIRAIYTNRSFSVRDAGSTFLPRQQLFGISQGCPLSPFLFVMVMSVLTHDAKTNLLLNFPFAGAGRLHVQELLYADDTLVVDADEAVVQEYMARINEAGEEYGLSFNWSKLEVLPVRCVANFPRPDGGTITQKTNMKYLGSVLSSDGRVGAELGKRIGAAQADFLKLVKVWSHAAITRRRKLRIFEACVVSKLLYCLHVCWLNAAETRKLDAFYVRCVRKIGGIRPSYYSRLSNQTVCEYMGCKPLSVSLKRYQLLYIANLARRPDGNVLRDIIFKPSSIELSRFQGPRKRGRPRVVWGEAVFGMALSIAGSHNCLKQHWANTPDAKRSWQAVVDNYCSSC